MSEKLTYDIAQTRFQETIKALAGISARAFLCHILIDEKVLPVYPFFTPYALRTAQEIGR